MSLGPNYAVEHIQTLSLGPNYAVEQIQTLSLGPNYVVEQIQTLSLGPNYAAERIQTLFLGPNYAVEQIQTMSLGPSDAVVQETKQYIKELILNTEDSIRLLEPKIQTPYRYLAAKQIKHILKTNRYNTLDKRYQSNISELKKILQNNVLTIVKADKTN